MTRNRSRGETHVEQLERENSELLAEKEELVKALQAIAKREGRYSRDQLTHASNTIEDMAGIAAAALAKIGAPAVEDATEPATS